MGVKKRFRQGVSEFTFALGDSDFDLAVSASQMSYRRYFAKTGSVSKSSSSRCWGL